MSDGPLITVLLPVRAPAPWLETALASVRSQTMEDWEVLAVVDGPDEVVEGQLRAFGARMLRIDRSQGLPYALNMGLEAVRSPLVARMDADDVSWPERLERQAQEMARRPDLAVLGTSAREVDGQGAAIGERLAPTGAELCRAMLWKNRIAHPTVMMRTAAVREVGGYNPVARGVEDYDLWLRLALRAPIDNVADVLLDYRIHPGQEWRRPIPPEAVKLIGSGRVALAKATGRSPLAARAQHTFWAARRRIR